MIEIVEVIDRSTQGVTRPFVCRGDDGEVYYVKGACAGRRSLICEWVAGNLGRDLGLPIPPFAVVQVPAELIQIGGMPDLADLGPGPAFGSLRQSLIELPHSAVDQVRPETQWDVLAFDWWVRNGDRTLTAAGGNPNLFWESSGVGLLVLDHNQAFDPEFDPADFQRFHAFARQIPALFGDLVRRAEYAKRLEHALGRWNDIFAGVPPEWHYADAEMTVATPFYASAALLTLRRCIESDFWTLP